MHARNVCASLIATQKHSNDEILSYSDDGVCKLIYPKIEYLRTFLLTDYEFEKYNHVISLEEEMKQLLILLRFFPIFILSLNVLGFYHGKGNAKSLTIFLFYNKK